MSRHSPNKNQKKTSLSIDAPVAKDVQSPKNTQASVSTKKEGRIVCKTVFIMIFYFIKLRLAQWSRYDNRLNTESQSLAIQYRHKKQYQLLFRGGEARAVMVIGHE